MYPIVTIFGRPIGTYALSSVAGILLAGWYACRACKAARRGRQRDHRPAAGERRGHPAGQPRALRADQPARAAPLPVRERQSAPRGLVPRPSALRGRRGVLRRAAGGAGGRRALPAHPPPPLCRVRGHRGPGDPSLSRLRAHRLLPGRLLLRHPVGGRHHLHARAVAGGKRRCALPRSAPGKRAALCALLPAGGAVSPGARCAESSLRCTSRSTPCCASCWNSSAATRSAASTSAYRPRSGSAWRSCSRSAWPPSRAPVRAGAPARPPDFASVCAP